MPEGDTVWRAARNLDRALRGDTVTCSSFRVPSLALASVDGAVVLEVTSAGKHILMRFDDGRTLHSHLRMDGDWQLVRQPASSPVPVHAIRVVIEAQRWAAFGLNVHDLELIATAEEATVVGHLGPDLLTDEFDEGTAVANLARDPRSIAEALLDQRNLAGIGNLYKSEVLFLHGIDPATPASSLDPTPLVKSARRLLRANREHPEQSTTGSLRRGDTHWVYGRRTCRRCAAPVRTQKQGEPTMERVTYSCPRCQPPE